jgi:spermidine synthase
MVSPRRVEVPRVRIAEDDGRRALLVDGVVQSVAVEPGLEVGGYWSSLLPSVRPQRALILGLGGGTLVHLLRRRFGDVSIVGVEVDENVLALAESELGLSVPNLEVFHQDAFAYIGQCSDRFDYVCVDLFRGGQFERGCLKRPFLRRLKQLAAPRAEIVLNLFKDRRTARYVQRVSRVLAVRSTHTVGKNVVVRTVTRG